MLIYPYVMPADFKQIAMIVNISICSANVAAATKISSRKLHTFGCRSLPRILQTARLIVAGVLVSPNGITLKWYKPRPGMVVCFAAILFLKRDLPKTVTQIYSRKKRSSSLLNMSSI